MPAAPSTQEAVRWLTPARLFGLATVVAALAASQQFFVARVQGEPMPFAVVFVLTVPFWYIWALFAPLVAWLAGRVPIQRRGLAWRAGVHAGAALFLSVAHSALHVAVALGLQPLLRFSAPEESGWLLTLTINWVQLSMNLFAYGVILGATHAADLYRRYRERELMTTELRAQLAQAQLHALRMQLNPHFLFNAMNTIAMLVRQGENSEAVGMLAGLSELLRYVLEETRPQEVPLRSELDFVERYLAIEQARFHDRLQVSVRRNPDLLDAHVPNLILQPLVENAIRHGIARRVGAGQIEISASREDGRLVLRVRDDGPGVDDVTGTEGVGLKNTRARLTQLYGATHRLELRNADGTGAVATISLPYHTAPTQDEAKR